MSRLILHVGTHKTATTSIQRFYAKHREQLAKRGVFYPDYNVIGRKSHYAHLGIVNAYCGRHPQFTREDAQTFFSVTKERSKNFDITILSAEPFYRHIVPQKKDIKHLSHDEYWTARRAYIEDLGSVFGTDTEIAIVFREQSDFAESMYQEHIKATSYHWGFRRFLKDFWYHFEYLDQITAWKSVFPKTHAISFSHLKSSADAVGEFSRLLGLPIDGLNQPPSANHGLAMDVTILKRMLNGLSGSRTDLRQQIEMFSQALPSSLRDIEKRRSFFQSEDELVEFQSQFQKDNEKIRPFVLHDLDGDQPVLPIKSLTEPIFGDRLQPEFLMHLFAAHTSESA